MFNAFKLQLSFDGKLFLQAALQNYCNGSSPVDADMWNGGYVSVFGRCWGGNANAAKLSQLHLAAAHLYFSVSLQKRLVDHCFYQMIKRAEYHIHNHAYHAFK